MLFLQYALGLWHLIHIKLNVFIIVTASGCPPLAFLSLSSQAETGFYLVSKGQQV